MGIAGKWLRALGLSTAAEKFAYGRDERFGVIAEEKIPDTWVSTTCGYCSVGCGMLLGVRDGRAVSVKGDPEHPVNEGKLCPKGLCEHETIHVDGRALRPLQKTWSGQRPIAWGDALDLFVDRVRGIQREHGADSFAILSTGQLVTEELYALGKLAQLGLGTRNYDGNTTLCMASAVSGYKRSFGSDGPPGCYEDIDEAETIVLIGANIADNHPILAHRLFKNLDRERPAKLIVIDPRRTKTAMLADQHLALRPRSDVYLLNGIAHILFAEGWVDEDAVRSHTNGLDELREHVRRFPPAYVAELTRLPEAEIWAAARAIGRSGSTLFAWTMGVNHSTQGTETVNLINNLALLTGNVGRVGGAPLSITGQCNAMGSRETSFTSSPPGYRKFESLSDRDELARLWNVDRDLLPRERGLAYPDIIDGILDGRIRGLWVIATNPVVSYPDQRKLEAALAKLEFLVVQDGYETPTSVLADLVLPAAIWGEKEGTFTNSERRVSKVNAAVEPPGEARSDFRIFLDIARRLDVDRWLYPGWRSPEDAFNEWRRVSEGRLCDYSGISYASLAQGSTQWPCPAPRTDASGEASSVEGTESPGPRDGTGAPSGQARLYADGRFETPDGKAQLFVVENVRPPEEADPEFPLLLNTGRTVEHWHTRTKTGRVPILEKSAPEAWVEVHPADAARLGIRNHDRVRVESRRGRVDGIRARVTGIVPEGHVFIPFHFVESPANRLTLDAACPISREPNFKQCAVRVSRGGV